MLAELLFHEGKVQHTDWAPPESLTDLLKTRNDAQIMGLELLAIALGLSTFGNQLRGKCVRVWTDNAGGQPPPQER